MREVADFLKKICSEGFGTGLGIACEDEVSGTLTCNTGVISMQDKCIHIGMDIRYPVTVNIETILDKLRAYVHKEGFKVTQIIDNPPNYIEPSHPLVEELMNAYREETGDDKPAYVMGGGTYARKIPNAVGFGPGLKVDYKEIGLTNGHGECHCADEAQSITNLKKAVRIYVRALQRLNKR